MNNKESKRRIAYDALVILGMLALLTFICRLWPILLLIILGVFIFKARRSNRTIALIACTDSGTNGTGYAGDGIFSHTQTDYRNGSG